MRTSSGTRRRGAVLADRCCSLRVCLGSAAPASANNAVTGHRQHQDLRTPLDTAAVGRGRGLQHQHGAGELAGPAGDHESSAQTVCSLPDGVVTFSQAGSVNSAPGPRRPRRRDAE